MMVAAHHARVVLSSTCSEKVLICLPPFLIHVIRQAKRFYPHGRLQR